MCIRDRASDVANAIFDGTDAVMLSGETAVGAYPVEAVKTIARISSRAEEALLSEKLPARAGSAAEKNITDAISYAGCSVSEDLEAAAIITPTESGHTARMVSKHRPRAPIIAVAPRYGVAAGLKLTWGVTPVLCPPAETTDEMFFNAIGASKRAGLIKEGDLVVITAGVPVGVSGTTNLLRVETVGEIVLKGTGIGKKAVFGKAVVIRDPAELEAVERGQIIIARSTDSSFLPALELSLIHIFSMPDIDIDFADDKRDRILSYVAGKYGAERVAQIITFGTMAARGAVRDVGRALAFPYGEVDRVAKMIPNEIGMTISRALEQSRELKEIYHEEERYRRLLDTSRAVEGLPRHASTHAAGVVISLSLIHI